MNNKTATANSFELESQIVMTSVKTLDMLYDQDYGADAVALYFFYYKTAKKQGTSQIRATQNFCMKGLKWGDAKFRNAKAVLDKFNLVAIVKSGGKWYVQLNYVKRVNSPQNRVVEIEPNSHQKQVLGSEGTNVLSTLTQLNASSVTNVTDNRPPKGLSCPLNDSSSNLKEKYPNGHLECVEYLQSEEEDRGSKFINKPKQFQCIHKILRAEYDFSDMDNTIRKVEKKYGKGGWDYGTLSNWMEKGAANA